MEVHLDINTLTESAVKAEGFLIKQIKSNGLWSDFMTLAGPSDEWVSGYIGSSLAESGNVSVKKMSLTVLRKLLFKRFWLGGWGYNHLVPPDADSTVWVLQLNQNLKGKHGWRIKRAIRFLNNHVNKSTGGIKTYHNSFAIRAFTKLNKSRIKFDGWCSDHICVSAAFAHLDHPQQPAVLDFLRKNQLDDGSWNSYWWTDKEYATALAAEALFKSGHDDDRGKCRSAVNWAISRIKDGPKSSFAASLLLRILLTVRPLDLEYINILTDYLLKSQIEDGSWPSSAFLRIPPPDITNPDNFQLWRENGGGGGSFQRDYGRLFTTATIYNSINKLTRIKIYDYSA